MALRDRLAARVNDDNVKWFTLGAMCFALFMAILDNLVVNIALPTIARDLDATTTQLQWIVSAYTLVFASLQITAGGLGDRLGRKRMFLIGLAIFTGTSFLAAFSPNIELLLAARAAQGIGAAFIMPLTLSIISDAFPPAERGRALGIWSAVSVSSVALGPIVGGALVEYASWQWVFLINVPIGIVAFFVASAVVRESRDETGETATDIPGTLLITGAIAALAYGVIEAGNRGWGDSLILGSFAASALLGLAFVWVENHTSRPMVPLRFFRSSTFTGANIDAFGIAFLMAGVSFAMTLYQQNVHGFSAVKTGLTLLPMVITMMVASPVSGMLINRVGPRRMISLGMAIAGGGALMLQASGVSASYWAIVPGYITMGFGMSLIWAPMMTAVLNSVESARSGVASAINGAVREIGFAFGIALLGTVMNRVYQDRFATSADLQPLRDDTGNAALQSALTTVGSGPSMAGHVIEDTQFLPGLEGLSGAVAQIRDVSSHAFMAGMDQALLVASLTIIAASALSYVLVKDAVVAIAPEVKPVELPADAAFEEAAD